MRSPFLRRFGMKSPFVDNETGAGFSPAVLFALNEPGVWYDPSDVANLDWRRNLLTWTEQFDNAAWLKTNATVTANATSAPTSAVTADALFETVTTGFHQVQQTVTAFSGSVYSVSAYVKANGRTRGGVSFIRNSGSFDGFSVSFNLSTETVSVSLNGTGTCTSSGITSVGNGWYRVFGTGTIGSFTDGLVVVGVQNDAGSGSYAGDITKGLFIWGAQLELGSTATEYQRITDVNTEVIERFPSATLYQDTAGTTPVTTPGQSVALALDKSKGLVLGSELVDTANTPAPWSPFGTNTVTQITNGVLIQGVNDARYAFLPLDAAGGLSANLVVGRTYDLVFTASVSSTTATLTATNAGNFTATITTSPQTFRLRIVPANAFSQISLSAGSPTLAITITNISVKELPGFHATQATAGSRPIYGIVPVGGRRNLLTRTEEFDNAYWTKTAVTVSANTSATTDPVGGNTADVASETTNTAFHFVELQTAISFAATQYTFTAHLKQGTQRYAGIHINDGTARGCSIDLQTGTLGTPYGSATASRVVLANGWYRLTVTATVSATASGQVAIYMSNSNSLASYAGNTANNIYIWGAQLETGSTATAYQRVVSQYDVTEAGVSSLSYLFFDGVDDWLVTPTITPGIDKAQVFAGVRKNSDAASGVVVETSAILNTNNGSLLLAAPSAAGANSYSFFSKGTAALVTAGTGVFAAAPNTSVLTGIGDISGDVATLRRNGALVQTTTTDQGTGNYLAYPAYIGRRFDTSGGSVALNGQIFSLIVRFGANLTADQINSTEAWVGGKVGFNWANLISPTIFARDETAVLDRFNQTIERRAL